MARILVISALMLFGCSTGCRTLALLLPEQTRTVTAEYPYLAGKQVAIVVRAPDEIMFEQADVQWEVSDHVRAALEANVAEISVVQPRKVVDYQRENSDWATMDPAALGKHFRADRVLEVELTQYTTREPESPHLYRGHIAAAVRVYNTDYPNSQHTYQADVQTVFPPDGPGKWGSNDREIRRAAMEAFAEDLAGKFYDRKIKVK